MFLTIDPHGEEVEVAYAEEVYRERFRRALVRLERMQARRLYRRWKSVALFLAAFTACGILWRLAQ